MSGPFTKLHHLCLVVSDIERSVAYYEALGIGPFEVYPPLREYTELEVPDPRAECQGEFVFGKETRPFQVLAFITRAPGGERRIHWLLRR